METVTWVSAGQTTLAQSLGDSAAQGCTGDNCLAKHGAMVTFTWILKEGASQGCGSTTPDCWNHLPVISSWKSYRQAIPTLESCCKSCAHKATDAGTARGSEGFHLLRLFYSFSFIFLPLEWECLSYPCLTIVF